MFLDRVHQGTVSGQWLQGACQQDAFDIHRDTGQGCGRVLDQLAQGGFHWPQAALGWGALAALTFLYGTAFTIMFTVLPRLGVVGNSAIMNIEPVFALVLAWAVLGQTIAAMQVLGGLVVVATVMWLGLRRA